MEEPQLDLLDSDQNFNESQIQMFLTIKRSKSNDSILEQFVNEPINEKKSLVLSFPSQILNNIGSENQQKVKIFKPKIRISRKQIDYKKNVCGYITKKIIRQYVGLTYKLLTHMLCQFYGCDYGVSRLYYLSKIQKITGPNHIQELVVATSSFQVPIKAAFKQFFIWFLKQRYIRYLILEGKMNNKRAYIQYKNEILLNLLLKQENQSELIAKLESTLKSS